MGDIHGHADPLHRLLHKLDYAEIDGVFRHPEREMIFVGDFIDRGPQQREVSADCPRDVRGGISQRGPGKSRVQRHWVGYSK